LRERDEGDGGYAEEGGPEAGEESEGGVVAEDGEEVLGHAVEDAGDAAGPVNADQSGAGGDALTEALALDAGAEGEVFDDLHAECFEAA
jgi:hypothetical protein